MREREKERIIDENVIGYRRRDSKKERKEQKNEDETRKNNRKNIIKTEKI
jgi:hypothetical protein